MSDFVKALVAKHKAHDAQPGATDTYYPADTHYYVVCPCGFRGTFKKEVWDG